MSYAYSLLKSLSKSRIETIYTKCLIKISEPEYLFAMLQLYYSMDQIPLFFLTTLNICQMW